MRFHGRMTVVLALRCADGIVLGTDSQITDSARGLSYPAQKLHPFGDTAAWGGSGSRAVLFDLEQLFDGCAAAVLGSENIGHAVQERVVPVLRRHYDQFVERVPGEQKSGATPATYVLVAGYADGHPFIVDIDPHGLIGRYEEVGFHAVGSGAAMAQQAGALLAHFRMTQRDVDYGVMAVVRILDTLRVTSPSIGGPIDVCRITADDAAALSEKDIDRVRRRVERWSELESKALDELSAD
jgi:20S proteasome alpha/beta subunit